MNIVRTLPVLAVLFLVFSSLGFAQAPPGKARSSPSTKAAAPKAPAGNYGCVVIGSGEYFDVGGFQLKPDGTYNSYKGTSGRYSYVPSTRAIKFSGGHYAETGVAARYYPKGPAKGGIPKRHDPTIVLKPRARKKDASGHSDVQYCYLQAGKVSDQRLPPVNLPKSH